MYARSTDGFRGSAPFEELHTPTQATDIAPPSGVWYTIRAAEGRVSAEPTVCTRAERYRVPRGEMADSGSCARKSEAFRDRGSPYCF